MRPVFRTLAVVCALAALPAVALAQEPSEDEEAAPLEEEAEPPPPEEQPEPPPLEEEIEPLDEDEGLEPRDEEEPAEVEPAEEPAEAEEQEQEAAEPEGPSSGGTTTWLTGEAEPEEQPEDFELILPPLYLDRTGDVRTTAVFPFFYQRSAPDDYQLLAGPYYYRRGLELNVDVAFPVFWSFRTVDSLTWVVPPVYYNRDADGFDWGVAPFVFDGRSGDDVYTVIPPLLTVAWANDERAYTFAGPFWRIRWENDEKWGIFPLVWVTDDEVSQNTIAAPFFFRFVDQLERSALTIIPPFYHRITPDSAAWGLAPLLLHSHDDDGFAWTVPPALFHYSVDGDDTRLLTPLFGYFDVDGESTLITPVYQRHRGETELDAVFPIFWSWRDPQQYASALVIPPVLYTYSSPSEATTIAFPFFGRWHERGDYTTWATPLVAHYESHTEESAGTWIFPNIQFSHTPTSSTFNFHPLVYSTSADTHRHLVIAPIYWDFEDYEDDSRVTIGFPLFWRFRNGSTVSQLALNTYYHHYREGGVPGWEFHFFPLFAYGEPRPGDHWWSILYGLVGYRRQGEYARAQLFYVPFQVDGPQ